MERDRLCFTDDLVGVTYCIDDSDFQITFDSLEEKDQIISVMKTLQILNYTKTLSMMNLTRPSTDNKTNIEFITKAVIEKLCYESESKRKE